MINAPLCQRNLHVHSQIAHYVFAFLKLYKMTFLIQLFQMTPVLTWESTVLCNVRRDMRRMIWAARCVSAASPLPSAEP